MTTRESLNSMRMKADGNGEILIYDEIGYGWFEEGVTAKGFKQDLKNLGNVKSIDVRINRSRKTVSVIARAEYAAAQEFGTSRLPARPFLRPALLRNKDRVVFGVVKAVNDVSVKVFKGQGAFDASRARYEDGT